MSTMNCGKCNSPYAQDQRFCAHCGAQLRVSQVAAGAPLDAQHRQVSVMFCDLVGSTALSQRLDAEDMREIIGSFQSVCMSAVARYDGHVAQFLGDGVLIYFARP